MRMPSWRDARHRVIPSLVEGTWELALGFRDAGMALCPIFDAVVTRDGSYGVFKGWHLEDETARDSRLRWWAARSLSHAERANLIAAMPLAQYRTRVEGAWE